MSRFSYPLRSLSRKPGRTAALVALTALLALSVFGGSLVLASLNQGLSSMEARLGADVILIPAEAASKVSLKDTLLQGTIGEYYVSESIVEQAAAVDGVEVVSPQLFLSTLKADCCSVRIQVIGFMPETDFVVQPWIEESYSRTLEDLDVVVGCKVETQVGNTLRIFNTPCRVVARLAETGTGLDTAVYCNWRTIHLLLEAAETLGVSHKITSDGSAMVSAVYVKIAPDVDPDPVFSKLSRLKKVKAVRTKSMLSEVSDNLRGVSRTVSLLVAVIWVLSLIILLIAFAMMVRERRRESAVLRLLGASQGMLRSLILRECALCSLIGAACGTILGAVLVLSFTTLIESWLNLPYLAPSLGSMLLLAAGTIAATVGIGSLAGMIAAGRLGATDPGTILREGT